MSSPTGLASGSNPSWSLAFWNKIHRYRCLLTKYWWVLLLTLSLCLCVAAYLEMNRPPTFFSTAKLSINVENRQAAVGDQGGASSLPGVEDMMLTQIDIIKSSSEVQRVAHDILVAKYPDMPTSTVVLDCIPHTSILTITATGPNAAYTERYLQATIEGYLIYRKKVRRDFSGQNIDGVRAEIQRMEDALKKDNDAIIQFQRDKGVVFGKDDSSDTNLGNLRKQREALQAEYDQLMLMTPEQGMERSGAGSAARGGNAAAGNGDSSPTTQISMDLANTQTDYRQAQGQIAELKAQIDDFGRDLRPKHPKMVTLRNALETQQRRVNDALEFSRKRIVASRDFAATRLKKLDEQVKQAEPQALQNSLLRSEFDKLVEVKDRDEKTYANLQTVLSNSNVKDNTNQELIYIMEPASTALAVPAPWLKAVAMALVLGVGSGVGILFLIDRMDDRMGTISDFQMHFSEHVLGQIPRDDSADNLQLLRPDDTRHQLVESFRNLRSTLLFMPLDGARPKTLLVTSAVPNEGKSTLSSNLALVLAFAGMKTLLIDADLRRGAIHQSFGVPRDPGLTDVLGHNVNWKLAIRTTGIENLHVLPRGRNVPQPSEYLLNKATDRLLQELYPLYDYIIIDSSPVLAADDTASLAPKIDATLFVTRMGFTSAKMSRKSLEILYKRQANIPGVILNQVDTSSPEFVYYQYEEYYSPATDDDEIPAHKIKKVKPTAKVS